MVDALRRVRARMCRRVFRCFCPARSRVQIVFGPFHHCASCERAAPDAPETIYRSEARQRMIPLDILRRFARERIPTIAVCVKGASQASGSVENAFTLDNPTGTIE